MSKNKGPLIPPTGKATPPKVPAPKPQQTPEISVMQINDLQRGIGQLVTSLYNQLRDAHAIIEALRKGEGQEGK